MEDYKRERRYNRKSIAHARKVKADYEYDVALGEIKPMKEYTSQFGCHTKTEFYVKYLTTDMTAEELYDLINIHHNGGRMRKKRVKQIIKVLDDINLKLQSLEVKMTDIMSCGESIGKDIRITIVNK